jgi:WhiB family redox-sensing transcriptional regulator
MKMNEWRDKAACFGVDPEVFFPVVAAKQAVERAKDICSACPVKANCLEEYLRISDRGIADGYTYRERKAIKRARVLQAKA